MYIVLDFWDKLREPMRAFVRQKFLKYIDIQTIQKCLNSGYQGAEDNETHPSAAVKQIEKASQVVAADETISDVVEPGDEGVSLNSLEGLPSLDFSLSKFTDDEGVESDLDYCEESDSVKIFVNDTIKRAIVQYQKEGDQAEEEKKDV